HGRAGCAGRQALAAGCEFIGASARDVRAAGRPLRYRARMSTAPDRTRKPGLRTSKARRRVLAGGLGAALLGLQSCATAPRQAAGWEARLRGRALVLLGEKHDQAEQHRVRLAVL